MSEELLRSRHAFGSEANVDNALANGLIDEYDILFLKEGKIGWIDGTGNKIILEDKNQIIRVNELPLFDGDGDIVYIYNNEAYIWSFDEGKCIPLCEQADLTELREEIAKKANADELECYVDIKYEIISTPIGTLIDYGDKEIRVMCPTSTIWSKQPVVESRDENMYYIGLKAYAPENAVGFKKGDQGVIVDEYFDFTGDSAGVDEFGRSYSINWLAIASYDESAETWTYLGSTSSILNYVGWNYVVEWYNADGIVVGFDSIRINLSNENCHSTIEPYYIAGLVEEAVSRANAYADEKVDSAIAVVEF